MLRTITISTMIILLLASCRQREVCCDIDTVAGIGWPSGSYIPVAINDTNPALNQGNSQQNNFDSSAEEMQPYYPSSDNTTPDNTTTDTATNTNDTNTNDTNTNIATDNIWQPNNNATEANNGVDNTTASDNTWQANDNATSNTNQDNGQANNGTPNNEIIDSVPQPKSNIAIEILAPGKSYIYNLFSYEIKVRNAGDVPAKNITVEHTLPQQLTLFSVEGNPQQNGQQLKWNVEEISPFASRSYKVTANGQKTGTAKLIAIATSAQGDTKKAQKYTTIDASAGLKINHLDTIDPVEVDTKTIYQIEITNQGNKDARELKVIDTIPSEATFVSAQVKNMENIGHEVKGKTVTFATIPKLSPGQKIIFEVEVEVIEVGDLINTIEVSTLDFGKTVKSQEGTKSFQN